MVQYCIGELGYIGFMGHRCKDIMVQRCEGAAMSQCNCGRVDIVLQGFMCLMV